MTPFTRRRAAPLIALLVIIFGLLATLVVLSRDTAFVSTPAPTVSHDDTSATTTVSVAATPTPFQALNDYQFHRSRDELMVALYHIEAEAAENGWTAQLHIRAGNLWRDMGNRNRALPHWEAANNNEPNANLLRQIAAIYIQRSEWHLASLRIDSLLTLAPNDNWALYHAGMLLAPYDPVAAYGYLGQVTGAGDDVATAQQMLTVIADQETSSDVILRIGSLLASVEEWSLAENAYQYAADFYYPFPEATAYVGLMRILQGKNGDAAIQEAIALDQDSALVHYVAGVYWRAAGEFARSEQALITAIILQPSNPTFFAELGNTYRAMGNSLEAETWLQTAVLISDNDPVIVEALNAFYADETLPQAQPIVQVSTTDSSNSVSQPSIQSANGWALHLAGDSEGGLLLVEQALEMDPDNPRALFDKARILIALDRIEEAIPLLNRLVAGDSVLVAAAQDVLDRLQADD